MVTMIRTCSILMVVCVFLMSMMVPISGRRLGNTGSRVNDRSLLLPGAKIVGGQVAPEYSLFGFSAGSWLCGGTLIHSDIFLTAAHCEGVFLAGVYLGGTKLDGSDTRLQVAVDYEIPNSGYSSVTYINDIMLVKLSTPVGLQKYQSLSTDIADPKAGANVTAIGYGRTSEGGSLSYFLQQVNLNVTDPAKCISVWGGTFDQAKQFCTYLPAKDTCQGDSGGPLFDVSGNQVGLVSFGSGCARDGIPAVNVRVSGYAQWIRDGICEHSDYPPDYCATNAPVRPPTKPPTKAPTNALSTPTRAPVRLPTVAPVRPPTNAPVTPPTKAPVNPPTKAPVKPPTTAPVKPPTKAPVKPPTRAPVKPPTKAPVRPPTAAPVKAPVKPNGNTRNGHSNSK